ncbi:SDR family oxidoreductase [Magnetospirillum sp. SS-4]|uniref:SDR family NAD(P)-dependent oxidoreductase n=1 Tax=Magnetospirillum sp. SS-4 TaxID=2681465 RepID=UPI0013825F48|nr:SDR family NAD(P)-dependent oxidoreductase [Magnetospirillum sp. SS-4]CAA7615915.1 Dehydrogenase [Magnetospirillum sp. SS-4]
MVSILITGASSGLGAALARAHARPGAVLHLGGRDAARLEAVAESCRVRGGEAFAETVDVVDRDAMAAWVERSERRRALDTVIANAGISAGTHGGDEGAGQVRAIFAVNVDGVVNTVMPAIAPMRSRRRGRIAIMSSLAGFRGFPGAPAYCASKALARVWGEGLRGQLAADGIAVSVVCPGFVDTPMTAVNPFRMPLLMDADRAAALIVRGLEHGRGRIAFPWPMHLLARLAGCLPSGMMDVLGRRMPRK